MKFALNGFQTKYVIDKDEEVNLGVEKLEVELSADEFLQIMSQEADLIKLVITDGPKAFSSIMKTVRETDEAFAASKEAAGFNDRINELETAISVLRPTIIDTTAKVNVMEENIKKSGHR